MFLGFVVCEVLCSFRDGEFNCSGSVVKQGEGFEFPCADRVSCEPYVVVLPRGRYKIELYGASAGRRVTAAKDTENPLRCAMTGDQVKEYGGNAVCRPAQSMSGAGGYTVGNITLRKATKFYLHIGGSGAESTSDKAGGYNGGGSGSGIGCSGACPGGSGGGATDLRAESDDLYHRVMVAGGGGGSDDDHGDAGGYDDGSGGAGGGETSQGAWIHGVYHQEFQASQLYGYSFGVGESSANQDAGAGGGGWYGGFSSQSIHGGGGGGSSFILLNNSVYPDGYAFNGESEYVFESGAMVQGVREGHGAAFITVLQPETTTEFTSVANHKYFSILLFIIALMHPGE